MKNTIISMADRTIFEDQQISNFTKTYRKALSNTVVKNFLKDEENYMIYYKAICLPTPYNLYELDQAFRKHYIAVRLVHYLSKSLQFCFKDYYQKYLRRKRFMLLNWDSPVADSFKLEESIPSEDLSNFEYYINNQNTITEHIQDPKLYGAVVQLNKKQLNILTLALLHNFTLSKIANKIGVSQQAVSKSYKQTLEKIKENYK